MQCVSAEYTLEGGKEQSAAMDLSTYDGEIVEPKRRNPLVLVGAVATAGVLCAGLVAFKRVCFEASELVSACKRRCLSATEACRRCP